MNFWTSKLSALKTSLTNLINNADNNNLKKYLLIAGLLGASNLAYSLFSIYTLLSFGLMFLSLLGYLKINFDKIKTRGLITYFSPKMQKVLLQRSLFDLICDIWFIPRISIYFKAFILPFFIKIDPADAVHQLEELSLGTRKAILTKGLLNIMPSTIKGIMLPNSSERLQGETGSSVESPEVEEQKEAVERNMVGKSVNRVDSKKSLTEMLFNDTSHSQKTSSLVLEESVIQNKGGVNSTDEENLVNHNFSLSKQMELKKSFPSFSDMNPLRTHLDYYGRPNKAIQHFKQQNQANKGGRLRERNEEGRIGSKGKRSVAREIEEGLRSQVLNSSRIENKKGGNNSKVEFSETWDRLEMFARKHREKLMRQQSEGKTKKPEMKGIFQTLHNIATLLSKDAILEKFEDVNLFKIFLMSSVALLVHFSISKKAKYWFYYTLQILMYVIGIVLSTGSIAIYGVKLRARYLQWKEQQKVEQGNEGEEKGETE